MNRYKNNNNIVLIGMSGVGKTTVGKYIAKKLNMKFIDTDDKITSTYGKTVNSIFNIYGEEYFRYLERRVIKSLSIVEKTVISTGGGVVLDNNNIQILQRNGIIFLLKASIDTLVSNLESSSPNKGNRPLLNNSSCLSYRIKEIYNEREELYFSSANKIISVDNKTIGEIGNEIIHVFQQLNPCSYF